MTHTFGSLFYARVSAVFSNMVVKLHWIPDRCISRIPVGPFVTELSALTKIPHKKLSNQIGLIGSACSSVSVLNLSGIQGSRET